MPAVSDKQRRWAFGNKGAAWARKHHFDTKGPLPDRADRRQRLVKQFVAGQKRKKARHGQDS